MHSTNHLLLQLVRGALGAGQVDETNFINLVPTQWDAIYRLASAQGVAALTWECVAQLSATCQPPREQRLRWALSVEHIKQHYIHQQAIISQLARFYNSHGIRILLLKGYGLSLCYPTPEARPCGDIDIWLFGEQARADELMRREWQTVIHTDEHHHTVFCIEGILVENHYDFFNVHAHASNRDLERLLRQEAAIEGEVVKVPRAASTAEALSEIDSQPTVYLPTADFNALFLLRHAASHFAAREIALRHVIDWLLFIDRYHAQIDWEKLARTARTLNMHRFMYCLHAAALNLGLNEHKIPPFERNTKLEERVFADILEPEFHEPRPQGNIAKIVWFKTRRWWANRWKHHIVYSEGLFQTFIQSTWSHLLKPQSIKHLS